MEPIGEVFAGSCCILYSATQAGQASPIGNHIQDSYNGPQVGLWLEVLAGTANTANNAILPSSLSLLVSQSSPEWQACPTNNRMSV